MRGNGIKHTCTTGTGALTLTAVSGSPSFADVFGSSGARLVEYTILNSSGVPIEGGYGTITLSTLSLARDVPLWTWDGTTYDATSPTAISVPASAIIECSPMASSFVPTAPFVGGQGDNIGMTGFGSFLSATGFPLANGTLYATPFLWIGAKSIKSASIYVSTAVAATNIRFGLYDVASDWSFGKLIAEFTGGSQVDSSTTGVKTKTAAAADFTEFWLPPGWYWAAFLANGAPSVQSADCVISTPFGTSGSRTLRYAQMGGQTYGALPSTPTGGTFSPQNTSGGATCPALFLKG